MNVMPIIVLAISRLIIVWKGIINDLIDIINIKTANVASIGLINFRLKGCNLKIYQTSIERIIPRKNIEINVAIAAPNPACKGIRDIFKAKFINKTIMELIKLILGNPVIVSVGPLIPMNVCIRTEVVNIDNIM